VRNRSAMQLSIRLVGVVLMVAIGTVPCGAGSPHRLALLIGSPWSGEETVIRNDIASFRTALAQRGFEPSEIKVASGRLTRAQVLDAVRAVSATTASWDGGEVFLYYTGHGWYSGDSAKIARPALALERDPDSNNALYIGMSCFRPCVFRGACNLFCFRIVDTPTCWPAGCRQMLRQSSCPRSPGTNSSAWPATIGSGKRAGK
jgi:hypothetical protein